GVLASTTTSPSTRKCTLSPAWSSRASRTAFGIVICPFDVNRASASMIAPYFDGKVRIPPASRAERRGRHETGDTPVRPVSCLLRGTQPAGGEVVEEEGEEGDDQEGGEGGGPG